MGFWPFGREPADVEIVSRVVTATAQNGYRVRAKLTLHFLEPLRQADADAAADTCAATAAALFHEAPDHGSLIGAEARLTLDLTGRYPVDAPKVRGVEIASVHVVGDSALSGELRRAVRSDVSGLGPPPTPVPTPSPGPVSLRPWEHLGANHSGVPSVRRRASSQIRSLQSLLMPPGTPPSAMGQFVAPNVRDAAARLLVGYLRAHDLVGVRHAAIDESSAEMLATLVPASDAPLGGYEASRASELARWQATFGEAVMVALRHETRVTALYLARQALALVDLMPALANAVIDSVHAAAFAGEASVLEDAAKLPTPAPPEFVHRLATRLTEIAKTEDAPSSIAAALAPLVVTVEDDLKMSAMIIKASSGA